MAIREMLKAFESDSVTVEELADNVKHPLAAVQKTVNTLTNDGFLIHIKDPSVVGAFIVSLSDLGANAKAPGSKPAKSGTATKAKGKTGPRSANAAKVITITKEGKAYSPRSGSRRETAMSLIKPGMTVEQYREAGGTAFDLGIFEWKGFITLK